MKLHDYQLYIINQLVQRKNVACWLDLGLGKTICTLTAIQRLKDAGEAVTALIIAPKTVAETVWKQEAEKWEHTSKLVVQLIIGTEKQRIKALETKADIYVISRDNTAWLFTQNTDKINMLVIDESTSFKDRSTRRWASLCQKSITLNGKKHYRKQILIEQFQRKILLSATPASESYQGLWAQIYLLDKGERLGKTIGMFRSLYMIPQNFGYGFPVYTKMKPDAMQRINNKLNDICIGMRKEDYLQLPERIDIVRHINCSYDIYNKMDKDGVVTVDKTDIIAGDTLTKMTKLQQITSGFIYDENNKNHIINSYKLETLTEILESTNENILVMYRYQYEKDLLVKLGGVPLETPEKIKLWQQGKIRIGLLYPASGGYGLNLYSGGSVIVWYTLPLSLEQYVQANARIHRQGQTKTVRVYHLLAKNTIDEHVYELLKNKKVVLDGLMSYYAIVRVK